MQQNLAKKWFFMFAPKRWSSVLFQDKIHIANLMAGASKIGYKAGLRHHKLERGMGIG